MEEMKRNPIGWFEIYVDDLQRAKRFYEEVFKCELKGLAAPGGETSYQMLEFPGKMSMPGASGTLVKMEGMKAGGNSVIIYFSSDDGSIEEARVVPAGGKIFQPKMAIGEYGFIVLAYDTEGTLFGIHSLK